MSYSRDPTIPHLNHFASVPYKPNATRLQTLDIWLPNSQQHGSGNSTWVVYVHGGAWRDPTQDSLCAVPTIRSLIKNHLDLLDGGYIAGIASINYRLSQYLNHNTDPSSPNDLDRNVQHPEHVRDVYAALEYLIKEYKVQRWIGVGHSCGATLLLQLPLASRTQDPSSRIQSTLQGLVLLAGIYDVATFLSSHTPPACPEHIAAIYASIITGAFGPDHQAHVTVSPTHFTARDLWGRYVVLGYSPEDQLVEAQQRDVMLKKYLEEGWMQTDHAAVEAETTKIVDLRNLTMGHDEVWEDGTQVADLIAEVVAKLNR